MATQVPIPKLGQSEETVSIVKWHKREGDEIAKGDVLFEVETDKAVLEVESQFQGTLLKVVVPEGREVPVMSIAAVIGEPGEKIPQLKQPAAASKAAPAPAVKPAAPPSAATGRSKAETRPATVPASTPDAAKSDAPPPDAPAAPERQAVSPRARKVAADYLIDLEQVPGSGPGGRVVEHDIHAYLESIDYDSVAITPAARNLAGKHQLPLSSLEATGATGRITVEDVRRAELEKPRPMGKMRRLIADRLQRSKQTSPHFYVTVGVDMTDLIVYRRFLKREGFSLSINDFVLKATALALRDFPLVNSVTEDGVSIRRRSHINIGMAVNLERGLVVPVLPDTDRMTLDELHESARTLANQARGSKLSPEELKGGTFTVSNMGMMAVDHFTAIINPGESAILAVASAQPTAAVVGRGQIAVRDIMKITLSADHRVIDGALAALFVNRIRKRLQDLALWQRETGVAWPDFNSD